MPLVGTSIGGLSLEEWVESFNRVAKDYIKINKYIWIDTVTIVCTTQEKKEIINKKISPICHTA